MSAPFCSALAWTTGSASFDGLRKFDDAAVNALVPKINIITDPSRARYEPHITVQLDNGRTLEWAETAGDASYRLTWAAATTMTYQLCEEVDVPQEHAQTLIDVISTLETQADTRALVSAVCAATTYPAP